MPNKVLLLVEDNPDDEELMLLAFQKRRMTTEVVVVRDGVEALAYLFGTGAYAERDPGRLPAVVLLDLKLPKIDGLEVLRRVRSAAQTRLLPVVILTSSREEQDILNGYSLGANSYVQKPVDFEQFTVALQQLELYWMVLNEPPPIRGDA